MEPAKIDWKTIDSVFVIDQVFENINAPQWVDFLAPSDSPNDDVSWFCRSDCKHPQTPEDFSNSTPTSKLLRSVSMSKLIADWTRREPIYLKRRGRFNDEDSENQNPDISTPPNHNQVKYNHDCKGVIKSSADKGDDYSEINLESAEEKPRFLKATQSAKDLFGGRDIFGKITEFCNELKKMTAIIKAKEREEDVEMEEERFETPKAVMNAKQPFKVLIPKEMNEIGKERKPLLEVKVDGKSNGKGKLKRNKMVIEDLENIPVSLDLNNIKREQKISPIRTNPPTPQGFSATRNPVKSTPLKGPQSRLLERSIFQEQQNKTLREKLGEKSDSESTSLVAAKEGGRALDVFWFLKPCTLSS